MTQADNSEELLPVSELEARWIVRSAPGGMDRWCEASWRFTSLDAALALGLLVLALAICIPMGLHLRMEAAAVEREQRGELGRMRQTRQVLAHLQRRQEALGRLQKAVKRYILNVQARPLVQWTEVMQEMSRRRPAGVWVTQIKGDGPRMQANVSAIRPGLVRAYLEQLRGSEQFEFVVLTDRPQGARLVARLTGD